MSFLKLIAAAAALASAVGAAEAATITFDNSTPPSSFGSFTDPATEAGFTYSLASGGLFLNTVGNPGYAMEGNRDTGGGVLDIASSTPGSLFTFDGLDFAAYRLTSTDTLTITVDGYKGGSIVATDSYTLAGSNPRNWTAESASNLLGLSLDDIKINLPAGLSPENYDADIDNVRLSAVPEPGTLALFAVGLAGFRAVRRPKN